MHTEKDKTNTMERNDITESTNTNRIILIMNENYSEVQKSEHPSMFCFYFTSYQRHIFLPLLHYFPDSPIPQTFTLFSSFFQFVRLPFGPIGYPVLLVPLGLIVPQLSKFFSCPLFSFFSLSSELSQAFHPRESFGPILCLPASPGSLCLPGCPSYPHLPSYPTTLYHSSYPICLCLTN